MTYTNHNGTVNRFPELYGDYYCTLQFKAEGTLIRYSSAGDKIEYGDYVYNDATRELEYKFDGNKKYIPAIINVNAARDITITSDYGSSIGRQIEHAKKIN